MSATVAVLLVWADPRGRVATAARGPLTPRAQARGQAGAVLAAHRGEQPEATCSSCCCLRVGMKIYNWRQP
jgi:hypothetical protein